MQDKLDRDKRNKTLAALIITLWTTFFWIVAMVLKARYGAVGNLIGQYLFLLSPVILIVSMLTWHKWKTPTAKRDREDDIGR